jgi:predicted nucleotidyltransferase
MTVAELPIQIDREQIARFCRERGIRKLSLFGSVLHQDFDPQRSDVDVLAEFEPGLLKSVGFQYFGYVRNWRPSSDARWIFVRGCIRCFLGASRTSCSPSMSAPDPCRSSRFLNGKSNQKTEFPVGAENS